MNFGTTPPCCQILISVNMHLTCLEICYQHVMYIHRGSDKNAQSLMHRHFVTVCSRITRFLPKCSEINW